MLPEARRALQHRRDKARYKRRADILKSVPGTFSTVELKGSPQDAVATMLMEWGQKVAHRCELYRRNNNLLTVTFTARRPEPARTTAVVFDIITSHKGIRIHATTQWRAKPGSFTLDGESRKFNVVDPDSIEKAMAFGQNMFWFARYGKLPEKPEWSTNELV